MSSSVPSAAGDTSPAEAGAAPTGVALDPPSESETAGSDAAPPRSLVATLLFPALPAAACAVLAYYVAGIRQADPNLWAAVGAGTGFVVGWVALLWTRRKG